MGLVRRQHFVALIAFSLMAAGALVVSPASAQEEYAPQTPVGRMFQGLNPTNWKMPQFKMPTIKNILPGQADKDRIIERKNGLVDEVKNTASRSWAKTKETLNPMRLIPTNFMGGQSNDQSVQQSGGFFSSLLGGGGAAKAEEPAVQPVSGVNDFLNMTKPRP